MSYSTDTSCKARCCIFHDAYYIQLTTATRFWFPVFVLLICYFVWSPLDKHMANVCSSGFYWLHQLRRVRQSLDTDSIYTNSWLFSPRTEAWSVSTALCVLSGCDETVFSDCLKLLLVSTGSWRLSSSEFQTVGPAAEKARRLKVLSW